MTWHPTALAIWMPQTPVPPEPPLMKILSPLLTYGRIVWYAVKPATPTVAASIRVTLSGNGAMLFVAVTENSRRAPPARGVLPDPPNTSWPAWRSELDAGLTIDPTKSIPGVAGLVIAIRATPGSSAGL